MAGKDSEMKNHGALKGKNQTEVRLTGGRQRKKKKG